MSSSVVYTQTTFMEPNPGLTKLLKDIDGSFCNPKSPKKRVFMMNFMRPVL